MPIHSLQPNRPLVFHREDVCDHCGEPNRLHEDTTGLLWIGCEGALRRRSLGLLDNSPDPLHRVFGDRYPACAQAVRSVLLTASGALVSGAYRSASHDEQIGIARRIAQECIAAYLKHVTQGGR